MANYYMRTIRLFGTSFENLHSNDVGASADAFDLESGKIVESEMPKEASNVKGKYH